MILNTQNGFYVIPALKKNTHEIKAGSLVGHIIYITFYSKFIDMLLMNMLGILRLDP